MQFVPPRISLVQQLELILKTGITQGRWKNILPGERRLSEELQVSRSSLRLALESLEQQGIVDNHQGKSRRLLALLPPHRTDVTNKRVCLLSPKPLWQLRSFDGLWIDELRAKMQEANREFWVHDSAKTFRQKPSKALKDLVAQYPKTCWLLLHSSYEMQSWFDENGMPAVIAGTAHSDIRLPSVDSDHRATCRHAAGAMLAHGHRRIVFLTCRSKLAGDIDSEIGFKEAFTYGREEPAQPSIEYYDDSIEAICRTLNRLFQSHDKPTAILIARSEAVLTAITHLGRIGIKIPDHVSLVARDEEPYLTHIVPQITRYSLKPRTYATKIMRAIQQSLVGNSLPPAIVRLVPTLLPGKTLARIAR